MNQTNSNTHSIFDTANFTIITSEMERLQETVLAWTNTCASGGFICGPYRVGKTRAVRAMKEVITNQEGEKIHVVKMTVPERDRHTVANVFRVLCKSMGIPTKAKSIADEMSDLVLHGLCELASLNSSRQVVLFVDEMHRLSISQLEAFAEVHDLMTDAGFNSCIIFIGNAETSKALLNQIKRDKYELIRGRFFTRRHNYSGITSRKKLEKSLDQFDWITTDDGLSVTQHFLGESLGMDWKLSCLAPLMWSIFVEQFKKPLGLTSWPMEYFMSTVRILLSDYLKDYEDDEELEGHIVESIKASGIEPCILDAA